MINLSMLKRMGFIFLFLTVTTSFASGNLLKNGDLEGEDISEFWSGAPGDLKQCYIFQEEDGNRCLKIEVQGIRDTGRKYYIKGEIFIGGVQGRYGTDGSQALRLKPDTTYEFGFDIKGTIERARYVQLRVWSEGEGEDGSKSRFIDSTIGTNEVIIKEDEWTRYEGEVTTDSTTHTGVLRIFLYPYEGHDEWKYKIGDYILLDNVVIREKNFLN